MRLILLNPCDKHNEDSFCYQGMVTAKTDFAKQRANQNKGHEPVAVDQKMQKLSYKQACSSTKNMFCGCRTCFIARTKNLKNCIQNSQKVYPKTFQNQTQRT